MAAEQPTTLWCRFGIRTYQLSDQDLLHPGELVDRLVQIKDVCRAGAFVGQLKDGPLPCHTRDNVERVKELLRSDKKYRKVSAELRQRLHLPGANRAFLIHSTGEGENARHRTFLHTQRIKFTEEVLAHNFEEAPKSELERVLDTGVGNFLDSLLVKLTESEPIMYGQNIDLQPTLSTTGSVKLSSMISNIQKLAGGRHVGIVSPTVYIGTEASTFNCHREDAAFEGVNRHVAGAPKIWFIVPPRFYNAFCLLLTKLGLPEDERLCSVYLQHKFLWIDPRIVVKYGIPVRIIIQRPNDIVFVLGNSIHWGVNLGMNINEAVNIASNTWARSGMICPPRCQCDSVAGFYFKFDLTPMLRSIGVSEDTIASYEEGDVMKVSQELRYIHPDLHPEMGVADTTATNVEHLLGPEADWDQLGKILKPLVHLGQEGFVGGFELVDLTAEEEPEDTDAGDNAQDHSQGAEIAAPGDDKESVVTDAGDDAQDNETVVTGTYKCPSCGKDTNRYGERGMTALRCHITSDHSDQRDNLLRAAHLMYSRDLRKYTSPSIVCNLCGKTVRGTATHLSRHQESRSCTPPHVNSPGASHCKRRKEAFP